MYCGAPSHVESPVIIQRCFSRLPENAERRHFYTSETALADPKPLTEISSIRAGSCRLKPFVLHRVIEPADGANLPGF
jgi:hypothetical protein